jgi:hypothetical protein
VLEWIGRDDEGFRGNSSGAVPYLPNWSGIIDLDAGNVNTLVSPQTDTGKENSLIKILSDDHRTIADAALYFVGANSDIQTGYGWNGALLDQSGAMHPIKAVTGNTNEFAPKVGSFSGIDIYEYYQLAWTAYAIVYLPGTNGKGTLELYYDFQPWNGMKYNQGKHEVLMQDVSTFQFMSIGSIMKIQVCTKSDLVQEYSLCKEKTIF